MQQQSLVRKRLVVNKATTHEQLMQLYIRLLLETVAGEGGIEEITFVHVDLRQQLTKLPPLPRRNNLRTLVISDCHLGLPELCDMLKYSYSLHTLNLSRNLFDDQACTVLAEFLRTDTQLRELYLHHNQITQQGAMELFASLQYNNTKLDTLNLESNHITLNNNYNVPEMPNLKMLILASNPLGVPGMQALTGMLTNKRSTLKWLDLSETEVGDQGVALLAQALAVNCTLEHVMLSGNGLSDEAAKSMAWMLENNTTLLGVDMALNPIGLDGVHSLANAVLKLVCRVTDIGLDVETQRIVLVAINTADLARKTFALRSAVETKRLGARSALRRLPRELCFMVASCLVGLNKEEDEDDDEDGDDEEEEEQVEMVDVHSD